MLWEVKSLKPPNMGQPRQPKKVNLRVVVVVNQGVQVLVRVNKRDDKRITTTNNMARNQVIIKTTLKIQKGLYSQERCIQDKKTLRSQMHMYQKNTERKFDKGA